MTDKILLAYITANLAKLPISYSDLDLPVDIDIDCLKYLNMDGRIPLNMDLIYNDVPELEDYVDIKRGSLKSLKMVTIRSGEARLHFKTDDALEKFKKSYPDSDSHIRHIQNHIDYRVNKEILAALSQFINDRPLPVMSIAKSEARALKDFKDFSTVEDATTLVRLANSCSRETKIGDRQSIGYWMIDIINGTVIPVARADEHHRGFDFVRHLISKGKLPESIYVPIWSGNQILSNASEVSENLLYIRGYKIWLANGGEDFFIETSQPSSVILMSDFCKSGGIVLKQEENVTGLSKYGKAIIRDLNFIVSSLDKHRQGRDFKENTLWDHADDLIWLAKYIPSITYDVKVDTAKYNKIKEESDYKELEQFIFAFEGIKNQIHILVKEQTKKDSYKFKDLSLAFGNLEEFERRLSAISEGL